MSSVSDYWKLCAEEAGLVRAEVARSEYQPKDGTAFITSVRSRVQNTLAGVISIANVKLCGQRIVDGSHRLSTADEVREYLAAERKKAEMMQGMEIARRNTMQILVPEVRS